MNTGSGDQYINFPPVQRRRSSRLKAADEMSWLAQRFVHPPGFGVARDVLAEHRTVFIDAPDGSGRTAVARMLLWELRHDAGKLYELLLEKESESRLDPGHIYDGDRTWLDLSQADGPLWTEIQEELSSLRAAVLERGAQLVVVLPYGIRDLMPEFSQYRVGIGRAQVHEVLRCYLRQEGVPQPVPVPPLLPSEEGRPLREITRFAQLIVDARKQAAGHGSFTAWYETAHRAWAGHGGNVAKRVGSLSEGQQRALLLATAMLHGSHADTIHRAEASLLRLVEHPPDERPVLERPTLDMRLREIGAEIDGSGRIRFSELDYDEAVRAYFWIHFPALRDRLPHWITEAAGWPGVPEAEWERLVDGFTEQCLDGRYQPLWVSLVQKCTTGPVSGRQLKTAALVLWRGLRDESHGRIFRRQIYDWSRGSDTPDRLAEVLVEACHDQLAVSHPDEAVVRLHHLARREHHLARRERGTRARDALLDLACGDRRLLRLMLSRVTDQSPERTRGRLADAGLFLDLADPEVLTGSGASNRPLIADPMVGRQLADGWRAAFTDLAHDSWHERAAQWLSRAASDATHRETLIDILIAGAGSQTDVLARLYAMTRRHELRADVGDLLLQKINATQGVQFA
jgi:hypothetical protein